MKKVLISAIVGATLSAGVLASFNAESSAVITAKLQGVKTILQEQKKTIETLNQNKTQSSAQVETLTQELTKANEFISTLDAELNAILNEYAATGVFKAVDGSLSSLAFDASNITFNGNGTQTGVKIVVKKFADSSYSRSCSIMGSSGVTDAIAKGISYRVSLGSFDAKTMYVEATNGTGQVLFTYNS